MAALDLQFRTMDVAGIERAYWIPDDQPRSPAPLIIAFHGLGMSGRKMGLWTELAERGPAAGFSTAFPDGLERAWDDHGCGRRDGADDAEFVVALIDRLRRKGATGERPPFLVGISGGAAFVERLARAGLVETSGIALISGTARTASRSTVPAPVRATPVLAMLGTEDRFFPYEGGPSRSIFRRRANLRVRLALTDISGHEPIGAETLVADWAGTNGVAGTPSVEQVPGEGGDPGTERLTWAGDSGRPPVVLYRIRAGGHGWPGSRSVLSSRIFGRIPKHLDATGLVLEFAQRAVDRLPASL